MRELAALKSPTRRSRGAYHIDTSIKPPNWLMKFQIISKDMFTFPDIDNTTILRLPNLSIRVAFITTTGYVSNLQPTVQNYHSSTRENPQPLTSFSFNNDTNNHKGKT